MKILSLVCSTLVIRKLYRTVSISKELLEASQGKLTLGIIVSKVKVGNLNEGLWDLIKEYNKDIKKLTHLQSASGIQALKDTYKVLGLKTKYVGSNEALLKRILGDKDLYQVNTVVDINNYMSIKTLRSIGSYDLDKLSGDIEFRKGNHGESYLGTTKRALDLNKLPVLSDFNGPFGSPTSDSDRALVLPSTTNLMTVIFSFDGDEQLKEQLEEISALFMDYSNASKIQYHILKDEPIEFDVDFTENITDTFDPEIQHEIQQKVEYLDGSINVSGDVSREDVTGFII